MCVRACVRREQCSHVAAALRRVPGCCRSARGAASGACASCAATCAQHVCTWRSCRVLGAPTTRRGETIRAGIARSALLFCVRKSPLTRRPPCSRAPRAVVEVFSGWAGPSKVLVAAFKKIYFEHSDAKLKFYTCSSSIGPCSKFASSCQSGFLFYKDGACVGEVCRPLRGLRSNGSGCQRPLFVGGWCCADGLRRRRSANLMGWLGRSPRLLLPAAIAQWPSQVVACVTRTPSRGMARQKGPVSGGSNESLTDKPALSCCFADDGHRPAGDPSKDQAARLSSANETREPLYIHESRITRLLGVAVKNESHRAVVFALHAHHGAKHAGVNTLLAELSSEAPQERLVEGPGHVRPRRAAPIGLVALELRKRSAMSAYHPRARAHDDAQPAAATYLAMQRELADDEHAAANILDRAIPGLASAGRLALLALPRRAGPQPHVAQLARQPLDLLLAIVAADAHQDRQASAAVGARDALPLNIDCRHRSKRERQPPPERAISLDAKMSPP